MKKTKPCNLCDGEGVIVLGDAGAGCIIEEKCDECNGTGVEQPYVDEDAAYDQAVEDGIL